MLKKPSGKTADMGTILQAGDLKQEGTTQAVILGLKDAPSNFEFSDYLLDVRIGKRDFVLPLKVESSTYQLLTEKLGLDENKWKGKTIELEPRYTRKYENGFVNVVSA